MKGFMDSLLRCGQTGRVPVIPDFKMISPSDGPLFHGRDVLVDARTMEKIGAPALSVVTEPKQFGGSLKLLEQIANTVRIPVLRKDFLKNRADLEESARRGAKAVLLICACMTQDTLKRLYDSSLELGLEPLVEAHSTDELRLASSLGAKLVGINNRDILTLERDGGTVDTTAQLASEKPAGSFLISESGIRNTEDVSIALRCGADAVLVGTAVWKAHDPVQFYETLCSARRCTHECQA